MLVDFPDIDGNPVIVETLPFRALETGRLRISGVLPFRGIYARGAAPSTRDELREMTEYFGGLLGVRLAN